MKKGREKEKGKRGEGIGGHRHERQSAEWLAKIRLHRHRPGVARGEKRKGRGFIGHKASNLTARMSFCVHRYQTRQEPERREREKEMLADADAASCFRDFRHACKTKTTERGGRKKGRGIINPMARRGGVLSPSTGMWGKQMKERGGERGNHIDP